MYIYIYVYMYIYLIYIHTSVLFHDTTLSSISFNNLQVSFLSFLKSKYKIFISEN